MVLFLILKMQELTVGEDVCGDLKKYVSSNNSITQFFMGIYRV